MELLIERVPAPLSFVQLHVKVSCWATAGMLDIKSKSFEPHNVIVVFVMLLL